MVIKKKPICYQKHHPDRELLPDYTISLRKWIHLYLRRLEQFAPTESNIKELTNVHEAVGWVLFLKKAKLIQSKAKENTSKEEKQNGESQFKSGSENR